MTQDTSITINGKQLTLEAAVKALQLLHNAKLKRETKKRLAGASSDIQHHGNRAPTLFRYATSGLTDAERTRWPRLGGIPDGQIKGGDFSQFKSTRPGEEVFVYMASAPMNRVRAKAFHLPITKIGISRLPNLLARQDDLRADKYGAFRQNENGRFQEDPGSDWEMQRSMLSFSPHENSPVSTIDRGLRIKLPAGYGFLQFERDFQQQARPCALYTFARSQEGIAHFAKLGLAPSSIIPMCRYRFGTDERWGIATEIYIARPRLDFSRVAIVAERLVASFITQSRKG